MTPAEFVLQAAERGLEVRMSSFEAGRVESAQGSALIELTEDLDVFVLGIEGFTRLGDGGIQPNLAWIFDASKNFENGKREEATTLARRFLDTVPKSDAVFLEFVLVPEGRAAAVAEKEA